MSGTSQGPGPSGAPTRGEVEAGLERMLASPDFTGSDRARRFLRYVVEEALSGRGDQLKAYNIALSVFDRDETFDPVTNPLVRIEAGKLRRQIERYYLTAGRNDSVRIDIPKGGYVPTFTFQAGPEPEPVEHAESRSASPVEMPQPSPGPRSRASLRQWSIPLVLLGLLLAAASIWLLLGPGEQRDARSDSDQPAAAVSSLRPSIMVVPFEDRSSTPGMGIIAKGISREILHKLAHFQELVVIDGALANSQTDRDTKVLARQLQAKYILMGEVTHQGEWIRVITQLSDTDGRMIWSKAFQENLSIANLFALKETISSSVAQAMAQPYGIVFTDNSQKLRREMPSSLNAYQCVLRAYEYRLKMAREEHREVRDCLEKAVEAAPDYADAAALLSLIYVDEFRFTYNPRDEPPERLTRALEMAKRSIELAPDNATAWRALFYARFVAGETELALEAGEKALSLNPNNADVKAIVGFRKAVSGDWEEGIAALMDAIAVAPLHPSGYYFALVLDHYRQDRYAEALHVMSRIDMADFFWTHAHYAMIYAQLGDTAKAQAALARTVELMPDFARRPQDIIRMEIRDEEVIGKMLAGLHKAGLDTGQGFQSRRMPQ